MKNIEKILKIWSDLEVSYFSNSSKFKTRLDYLKFIVGYDSKTNTTKIDYLNSKLSSEAVNYTEQELVHYSFVTKVLECVDKFLVSKQSVEINNLNIFVASLQQELQTQKSYTRKLDKMFFNNLLLASNEIKDNTTEDTSNLNFFSSIYEVYDTFGDTYILDNEVPTELRIIADHKDNFILYRKYDLDLLLDEYSENPTEFKYKVLMACKHLMSVKSLRYNSVFLSSKYLKIDKNNDATLTLGSKKIKVSLTKRNIIELEDLILYSLSVTTKYDTFKVFVVK